MSLANSRLKIDQTPYLLANGNAYEHYKILKKKLQRMLWMKLPFLESLPAWELFLLCGYAEEAP